MFYLIFPYLSLFGPSFIRKKLILDSKKKFELLYLKKSILFKMIFFFSIGWCIVRISYIFDLIRYHEVLTLISWFIIRKKFWECFSEHPIEKYVTKFLLTSDHNHHLCHFYTFSNDDFLTVMYFIRIQIKENNFFWWFQLNIMK